MGWGFSRLCCFQQDCGYKHSATAVPKLAPKCVPCNVLESKMRYWFNVKSVISYQPKTGALNHFGTDLSTLPNGVNKDIKITREYICFTQQNVIPGKDWD